MNIVLSQMRISYMTSCTFSPYGSAISSGRYAMLVAKNREKGQALFKFPPSCWQMV